MADGPRFRTPSAGWVIGPLALVASGLDPQVPANARPCHDRGARSPDRVSVVCARAMQSIYLKAHLVLSIR